MKHSYAEPREYSLDDTISGTQLRNHGLWVEFQVRYSRRLLTLHVGSGRRTVVFEQTL